MVMRTIEIKEISLKVEKNRINDVKEELKKEFGEMFEIISKEGEICVRGDLHDYKKHNKIIRILSGGKHGTNI